MKAKTRWGKRLISLILALLIICSPVMTNNVYAADNVYPTIYNNVNYAFVYDYDYYISRYPDIRKVLGTDPNKVFWHFINYGMREGRQAKADFNVNAYKNRYTDLQKAYGNNLPMYYLHYCIWGHKEGRSASELDYTKVFNAKYYADRYPDLKATFGYNEVALFR